MRRTALGFSLAFVYNSRARLPYFIGVGAGVGCHDPGVGVDTGVLPADGVLVPDGVHGVGVPGIGVGVPGIGIGVGGIGVGVGKIGVGVAGIDVPPPEPVSVL